MSPPVRPMLALAVLLAVSTFAGSSRAATPTHGECVAASEESLKLRDQQKLQSAREQLLLCASDTCPGEIRQECLLRIDRMNASIPTIVFAVKDATGNDLSAVNVTMDGQLLVDHLDGAAISVDPGSHTFRFEVPGQPAVEKTLLLRTAEKDRLESIVLGVAPPAVEPPSSAWSPQKSLALGLGGVGVVGIAVGSVFGAVASSNWSRAKQECFAGACPDYERAVQDEHSASSAATVSTIALVTGGVTAMAAVIVWLTAPSSTRSAPATAWTLTGGPARHGLGLGGEF